MAFCAENTIEQWACSVDSFSSQYNSTGWSATQVLGPPKVYPNYGDMQGAWASKNSNSREFIEISFEQKVVPTEIKLYETYHAGGVSKVLARNPENHWIVLYTAPRLQKIVQSRIFSPPLTGNSFPTKQLRIEIDCSFANSWVEIDAVQLIGNSTGDGLVSSSGSNFNKVTLWVNEVTNFSTQYNNSGWSARSVIGEPRVYPRYGDIEGSWATSTKDAHQFIEVKFREKLILREINIYETFHAGGVKRVLARNPAGGWVKLYETGRVENITRSRIFSPNFKPPDFAVDELRIDIDCTGAGTWVELDAINIVGYARPRLTPLSSSLSQLVNNKMFSDVEIIIDGLSFYAHKAILVKRSSYFKSIFVDGHVPVAAQQKQNVPSPPIEPTAPPEAEEQPPSYESIFGLPSTPSQTTNTPTKEQLYGSENKVQDVAPVQPESKTTLPVFSSGGPLVLHNVTSDVFWIVLYFIYTDEIPDYIFSQTPLEISTLCFVKAIRAADVFDLPHLKPLCFNKICTVAPLSVDNVCDVFEEAIKEPVQGNISQMAQHFMMGNRKAVRSQRKFLRLPIEIQLMLFNGPEVKDWDLKSVKSGTCCLQ